MFQSARLKLTFWYLIIIMIVSGFFSVIVYRGFTKELGSSLRFQSQHGGGPKRLVIQERSGFLRILPFVIYEDEIAPEEYYEIIALAKHRFFLQLLIINGGILFLAGLAGYFLAGKTLQPIELMLGEQKRFVADASHELRTPLTSMKTEAEVALRDNKLKLQEAKELLKSNLQEVDKMKNLTDYLLSLSRYEANGKDLSQEKVDLVKIIESSIKTNVPQAKTKKISIVKILNDVKVKGNIQSLIELFSIIINNAIKYSLSGSVVQVLLKKRNRYAQIEIIDKGPGISKKDIPNIFDRFFRSDTSRNKTETDGYGLGLSIAKKIVEIHDGDIIVKSELGKGTTFKIYLPL